MSDNEVFDEARDTEILAHSNLALEHHVHSLGCDKSVAFSSSVRCVSVISFPSIGARWTSVAHLLPSISTESESSVSIAHTSYVMISS